ncbi:MAG TPA: 2Fe-2S iron-sulfur cluster-binding protein [Candidatus Glassbacteria bacterium]|nr:2Fe-2S iron-sulfur cluster-binding protein [Candidatus Glassbacteria bacterium]
MNDKMSIFIDGAECSASAGQSILQAADEAGIYIPRLCHQPDLRPNGSCRVCTVKANGRNVAACTTPVADGMIIENEIEEIAELRRALIEMLFVEGNHYCPFCEKSGNCELQAIAYRLRIMAPRFPYQFPARQLDASHQAIFIDGNRCIQCGRCVRAAEQIDKKPVLGFIGRGGAMRIKASSSSGLAGVDIGPEDACVKSCLVGCIIVKDTAYRTPIGRRTYDHEPIGSDIEARRGRG